MAYILYVLENIVFHLTAGWGWKLISTFYILFTCPRKYSVPIYNSSKIQCSYLIVDWGITCRILPLYTVYCMPSVIQCSYLTCSIGWGGRIYVLYVHVYCIPMMIQWSYLTVGWGVRIHVIYTCTLHCICSVRQCSHTLF